MVQVEWETVERRSVKITPGLSKVHRQFLVSLFQQANAVMGVRGHSQPLHNPMPDSPALP